MEVASQDVSMEDGIAVGPTNTAPQRHALSAAAAAANQRPGSSNAVDGLTAAFRDAPAPIFKSAGIKRNDQYAVSPLRKDLPRSAKFTSLPYASSQTGLVYDVRMRFHVEAIPSEANTHPEDPRRIHVIFEAFVNAGLAWREGVSGPSCDYYMGRIDARMVTKAEVLLVHTAAHWDWVQQLATKTAEELFIEQQHPPEEMESVYMSPSTPSSAGLSAGGAIEACRAIMLGKVKNAFAVIRPPGHHAEREDAKGFCFFDNVSIATKVCQKEFGERCRKVFILDWDVHHGNGIQQANYEDPNVLYISLHLHKAGTFYPERLYRDGRISYGDHLHCGAGPGLGKNVNIPWSQDGMGDADYIYAFQQVVMPIATEFDPDLVIIAAGFDAAEGDILGACKVTPAGFAHMTHMLMSLADGKLAVCLEGGYNLDSIARSACAVGRTLMGEPPDRLQNTSPTRSSVEDVQMVVRQQSRFWTSLYPKDPSQVLAGMGHGERMHNVVRRWQAETLFDEYSMTPLFIHREQLAKEFENQVLATPDYNEARPLLVILHDPPELIASPDPRTGRIDLHNTWMTDIVKTYIDEAIKNGFSVIDVNLPKHISDHASDEEGHRESNSTSFRTSEATTLLTYLWENYIEVSECTHVFLMGTNIGHGSIIGFIKSNEERAQELITATISFVEDVPLLSCKSSNNHRLPDWYQSTSLVFVAQTHNFWDTDLSRKPKKRFGTVFKSASDRVSEMLRAHKDTVLARLLDETAQWRQDRAYSDEDRMDISAPAGPNTAAAATAAAAAAVAVKNLPPVRNFAMSPAHRATQGAVTGNNNRAPATGSKSPPKMPLTGSFASLNRPSTSRSPV